MRHAWHRTLPRLFGLALVLSSMWVCLASSASSSSEATGRRTRVSVDDDAAAPESAVSRSSGPGVYEDGLPYCQNNLDCDGTSNWCKDRGDGIKVCMSSKGHAGDYCTSGLDCGNSLFCKDRGDGLKQCMGNKQGKKGSFCASNLDCGQGHWCKNRGDGLKVCM